MKAASIKILLITLTLLLQSIIMEAQNKITYTPIGIFHSEYTTDTGAPRQGILMPETKGTIELDPQYYDAMHDLELFEYIWVLFHFSKVETWEPRVKPPASTHRHSYGLFATRSPKRPNPIGLSLVKLEKVEKGTLHISGIDAFDQTPVLDIKPYLPSIDQVKSLQNESIETEFGHHDENFINDSTFFK